MTFGEAVKALDKVKVEEWWINQAPKSGTVKALRENWKYHLFKDGKRLPFKWSLELLFKDLLKENIRINSDYSTRSRFAENFGFKIQEDLVYDNASLEWLKDYYKKVVWNKNLFKLLLSHLNNIVQKNHFEPSNLRAAISGSAKSMLVIGMRAVFVYRDHKTAINEESDLPKAEVSLILEQSFISNYKGKAEYTKVEEFTGHGNNCLVRFQIDAFEELETGILENHTKCVVEEYNHISNTKRAQWNVEAKTTNDALKVAIFKNLEIEKMETIESKQYFDLDGLHKYRLNPDERYNRDNSKTKWFRDTQIKLEFFVGVIGKRLNKSFTIVYDERPNVQAGRGKPPKHKNYVLKGFIPSNSNGNSELFLKFSFSNLKKAPVFNIDIDLDDKKDSPFKSKREQIRKDTWKEWAVNENFPKTYNQLVELIIDDVKGLLNKYYSLTGSKNESDDLNQESQNPLNQILYGPPGTGKTYSTIVKALAIIEEKLEIELEREGREDLKKRFEAYVKSEQIVFSTFHQSMSYEDFVEGIKPILDDDTDSKSIQYTIEQGIFKKCAIDASFSIYQNSIEQRGPFEIDFSVAYDILAESLNTEFEKNSRATLISKSGADYLFDGLSSQGNILMKHAEGKENYTVSKSRLEKLHEGLGSLEDVKNIHQEFRNIIGGSNASIYWSVLNEIRTLLKEGRIEANPKRNDYTIQEKINQLRKVSISDFKDKISKPYVLIIDEINRGNVSQIFGELITLIEEDKRAGNNEALEISLPYSKEKFSVPNNLYIIGTMNTADRSVEALDSALRRRFSFQEMMPNYKVIENVLDDKNTWNGFKLSKILKTINQRIEVLIDRDHTIGHSYFLGLKDAADFEKELKSIFKDKIIPLLQEYFFNDYGKIQLVLGKGFIKKKYDNFEGFDFAENETELTKSDFEDQPIFELVQMDQMSSEEFKEAIQLIGTN